MRVASLVVVGLLSGAAASAEPPDVPQADLFGGYSYARASDLGLHGWNATFGYNFTRHLEVEAEVGAHYAGLDDGTDLSRLSVLAGPRFNFRAGRVTPFLRALGGAVRTSSGLTVQGVNISARDTDLGAAAGGGVEFAIGRHWGIRLQADYFMVHAEGETTGDPRAALGISYRLGQKDVTPRNAGR